MDKKLQQIKTIIGDPRWFIIQEEAERLKDDWRKGHANGNSEFEVLKETFKRDGKIEGLNEFFNKLKKIAETND